MFISNSTGRGVGVWTRVPGSLEGDVGFVLGLDPPVCLRRCIPGVDIPVPASLEQSCPTVLPLGYWGCSSLSVDEGSPQELQGSEEGLFDCFPSLLGSDSAAAASLQGCCCCLEKSCCTSGMFTEVSKPGSGKRDNCRELKKKIGKKKGKQAKLFNSTQKENMLSFLSQVWNWKQMVKQFLLVFLVF